MVVRIVWFWGLILVLASCGTSSPQLSSGGEQVKILLNKKESGCKVLDKVVGENDQGSQDLAENNARNLAGKVKANAIYFDEVVATGSNIKVYGTAYWCQ